MPSKTAIEMNPPLGGNCGWGEPTDPLHHRLYKERMKAEYCEDIGIFSPLPQLLAAKGEESAMEKLAKAMMPYDDGWDFDYVDKLLYRNVPYVNQGSVGSCVGAGSASAVASKIATEILIEGDPEEPFGLDVDPDGRNTNLPTCGIPFVGYHYGAGKTMEKWTGSKFSGRGWCSDGSYCSAQIWALKTSGFIPCSEVKNFSKGPQSDDVRSWGCNQRNELNDHLEIGLKYRMENTVRVRNGDELKNVITVLKQPCMICSSWAFVPDSSVSGLGWVYRKSGSWAHNLSIVACVLVNGVWYVKVRNQWGKNAHKDGWDFWIRLDLADRWMRDAECQSIGELSLKKSGVLPSFPVKG